MRERSAGRKHARAGHDAFTVDIVLITPRGPHLDVLAVRQQRDRGASPWSLPWTVPQAGETLMAAARRLARETASTDVPWMEQVGAFADGSGHPSGAELSVCFVGVIPVDAGRQLRENASWREIAALSPSGPRQAQMLGRSVDALRLRMDFAPIPFHLLPSRFTLSELQQVYELLLGRRLHKASFRRALHAAWLVVPTNAWRREGRGRPAQLFRFAPRKRRGRRRGVRFTLL